MFFIKRSCVVEDDPKFQTKCIIQLHQESVLVEEERQQPGHGFAVVVDDIELYFLYWQRTLRHPKYVNMYIYVSYLYKAFAESLQLQRDMSHHPITITRR